MTAFELFQIAFYHRMGQFLGHLLDGRIDDPRDYIKKAFNEDLKEYYIDDADCGRVLLSFDNPANRSQRPINELKSIEVKDGYWLCLYNGHTAEWMLWHNLSKAEAVARRKELYMRYFRHQDWFWIVKV